MQVSVASNHKIFFIKVHVYFFPFQFNIKPLLCSAQVILGSQEGSLQLWNISTKKKLYEFKDWKSSICSCVSSPALDVVAVGCADGKIHVHNIRYDEELVTFTHSTRGAVTALSFSTGKSVRVFVQHYFASCYWILSLSFSTILKCSSLSKNDTVQLYFTGITIFARGWGCGLKLMHE